MSKPWQGEQEFLKALQDLLGHHLSVPTSKIRNIVAIANKYVADFKMVVYEIEKFIRKSDEAHRLGGLFVIDSLCKQHSKEKDIYTKRFSVRLKDTVSHFAKLSNEKQKSVARRIIEEWHKKEIFPASVLNTLELWEQTSNFNNSTSNDTNESTAIHKHDVPLVNAKRKAATELKKASKLCPFKESCPFGDKCRFNHTDSNTLEHYAARVAKRLRTSQVTMLPNEKLKFRLFQDTKRNKQQEIPEMELVSTRYSLARTEKNSQPFAFLIDKDSFDAL